MIIKKDLEQNTEEWLKWRKQRIGASDAPIIMRKSPWKTPEKLYEEKLSEENHFFESNAMARGKALEPYARAELERELKLKLTPVICVHEEFDYLIASLDGLSEDQKTAVEIKCPGVRTHILATEGKIEDHYKIQMQHQMAVTGLDSIIYYSYDGEEGVMIECKRDQELIDKMLCMEHEFYRSLISKKPIVDRRLKNDEIWKKWANLWKDLQEEKKALQEKEEECRKALIELSDGDNYGEGIYVSEVEKKGSIDYSKIPVLKTIDLEKYRKNGSKYWRIGTK